MALPVHAARPLGLGRHADVGARRRGLGRPAAQADAARQPQRLLLRASTARDGKLLLAKPFVKNLTWASGIGADGRPILLPNQEPTAAGTKVCPSQDGATNWFSPSFNPATGLYYVQTFEKCSIYTKSDQGDVGERPDLSRRLAAHRDRTEARSASCARSTSAPARSGGSCRSRARRFVGRHARHRHRPRLLRRGRRRLDGRRRRRPASRLWSFQTNQTWNASPMTYMFDGKQYVAVAAGPNIIALAIPDR